MTILNSPIKEKSCGAIVSKIINGTPLILLIRHMNGGHWAFPKGHVEENETEVQTATREILEETGLHAEIDTGFRYVVTYSPKENVVKDVVYFSATTKDESLQMQAEEVTDIKWVNLCEAMEILTYDNDKKILESYIKYAKKD